jgi:hypothetical protein
MNQSEQQPQENEAPRGYWVMTPEGEKHREDVSEERPDGTVIETTMEETAAPSGTIGWKEVAFSRRKIIRPEYDGENGAKLRDIIYEKVIKGASKQRPNEEAPFFFRATQIKGEDGKWYTIEGTEKRFEETTTKWLM